MNQKLEEVVIDNYDERYRKGIIELHKDAFMGLGAESYKILSLAINKRLDEKNIVLALYNKNLSGLGQTP